MSGHLERVERLVAQGDVEGAKVAHNASVVRVRDRLRTGAMDGKAFMRRLPELRQAKAVLEAADRRKR